MAEANLGLVSMLLAMTPEEGKQQLLAEIGAMIKEADDAKADLQKQRDDFAAEKEQARQDRMAAEAAQADIGQREAVWTQANDGLASAQKSHIAEVDAFHKMRETIEAFHDERERGLKLREATEQELNAKFVAWQDELTAREATVSAREQAVARKHEALTAAMAA